jgi:phosphohistidine phosphatase
MLLYLVQHGEATSKEVDPERPLTDQGANDVQRLGVLLAKRGVGAARILHSGKTRTRQTADALAAVTEPRLKPETIDGLEPMAPPAPMATRLVEWTKDTVLVGHQPFLGRLAARLLCGREDGFVVDFVPGTAMCLKRDSDGVWSLIWMLPPGFVA